MVLDGIGIGPEEDAFLYGDEECNTLGNIAKLAGGINLPILESLGLGRICNLLSSSPIKHKTGSIGRCFHQSPGKGTTLGHWEIVGCIRTQDFVINKGLLSEEFVKKVQNRIGCSTLHNAYAPSGTKLVKKLGPISLKTGTPILYSSNDSVIQLAAHESSIPLTRQYEMCNLIREILEGDFEFGRVICRPFSNIGENYYRTPNRKDFHNSPPTPNLLTYLAQKEKKIACIGVVGDILTRSTYNEHFPCGNNIENFKIISELLHSNYFDLVFTNMNDFDPLLHLKKIDDIVNALIEFDTHLGTLLNRLSSNDLLVITSDHGCDPLSEGSDNTRELCPLIITGAKFKTANLLSTNLPLSYTGKLVVNHLGLEEFQTIRIQRG